MTAPEKAMAIAKVILEGQMRQIAFTSVIERYRLNGVSIPWQEMVQAAYDELVAGSIFRDRIAELQSAFEEATPGDELIRILHRETLDRLDEH